MSETVIPSSTEQQHPPLPHISSASSLPRSSSASSLDLATTRKPQQTPPQSQRQGGVATAVVLQQAHLDKLLFDAKSHDHHQQQQQQQHQHNRDSRDLSTVVTSSTCASSIGSNTPLAVDPGLLFASNQSSGTASTITTTGLSGGPAGMMDYQTVEQKSLLSAAAQRKSRRLVLLCGMCASLTSILLGYDVGVMSVARQYVDKQLMLSSVQSEVVMGSLNLMAALGGLIAGKTADRFGRNRAIALACLIFLTGSACMTLAWNFRVLLVGRVVTGLGVGCGFVIAPVYIAEITPPEIRGRMVSLTDIAINVGIVLGAAIGFCCEQTLASDDLKWRVMLGVGIVPPIVILLFLRYLPESPRWLLLQDRVTEARHVLKMIVGQDQAAERELVAIEETIQMERDVTTDWSEVLWPRHRAILLPVLMGLGLGFFQQASGSEATVYYSPQILKEAGVTSSAQQSLGNIAICTFKFVGEIVAMFSMDKVGRKPLFVLSAVGSGLFLVLAGLCFQLQLPPLFLVSCMCLFMGFFSVGMGAITFVVASEIFPLPVRGKAMALAVFTNRLLSGVVALTFLSLVDAISYARTFWLFAAFSFVSTIFYGLLLPETKGRTLEEISILFEKESTEHEAYVRQRQLSSSSGRPSLDVAGDVVSSTKYQGNNANADGVGHDDNV